MRNGLLIVALIIVAAAALSWANFQFADNNPGGNDFLPRWLGTRLYLSDRLNPYSEETTTAIQQAIYGRPAIEGDDQALFAYPFYSMIVFSPFSAIADYALARALWMTTLQIALLLSALIAISLGRWQPGRGNLIAFLIFSIAWYHGARPMINGNAAILVALFIAAGLWLLRAEQDVWAGIVFSLSTIKPQMVVLFLPLVIIWAVSHRRLTLVLSYSLSMLVLLAASFLLQPTWLLDAIRQVLTYSSYTPPGTLAGVLAQWWPANGQLLGWIISILLSFLLLYEWWLSFGKNFDWLLWTAALTLVLSQLVGVPTTTANFASLLIVFPLIFAAWDRRIGKEVSGPILAGLASLFVLLWLLFVNTLLQGSQFREHLIMLFPVPVVLLINLYWLRWWALRPAEVSYPAKRARRKK